MRGKLTKVRCTLHTFSAGHSGTAGPAVKLRPHPLGSLVTDCVFHHHCRLRSLAGPTLAPI